MTTAPSYFDRAPNPSRRPGLSHLQASPSSPHTPLPHRTSSALSSPSLSYRAEEDALVFEFGTRHLSAGFTGESYPRCRLGFGQEESRRVGDYRRWMPGYEKRERIKKRVNRWGEEGELWKLDLRDGKLGLVADKIERSVRDAYTRFLLVDSKSRRLVVVVPSVLPHQLLSTILSTLFEDFFVPSITLLSPPILATVAAGCRSGLIVDIGWRETVVTGIYEYREVSQYRTTRAMRAVCIEMAKLLERYDGKEDSSEKIVEGGEDEDEATLAVDVDQAEEVTTRMAWCQSLQAKTNIPSETQQPTSQPSSPSSSGTTSNNPPPPNPSTTTGLLISIPSPSTPTRPIHIPFTQLANPVGTALLATNTEDPHTHDAHDLPLHTLIHTSLLHLPPDVRGICMARIMFTGGGSNIPGLKTRLLDEVSAIVASRGWDPVTGKAADLRRSRLKPTHPNPNLPTPPSGPPTPTPSDPSPPLPAYLTPQTIDPIDLQLEADRFKDFPPVVEGVIRGVETLGAWAGASLLSNLRIKGAVDIDRDSYLQYGLAGAKREAEVNVVAQKGGGLRVGMAERVGWTLGGWA